MIANRRRRNDRFVIISSAHDARQRRSASTDVHRPYLSPRPLAIAVTTEPMRRTILPMADLLPRLTPSPPQAGHDDRIGQDRQTAQVPPPLRRPDHAVIDGLYLHVPFCFHKCHYCDFYSIVDPPNAIPSSRVPPEDRQAGFVGRLIEELEQRSRQIPLRPRTIFVGGGTPTLLRLKLWQRLLGALASVADLAAVEEFTVEANPETVTTQLMEVLAAGGVNRISIGAQSFNPQLLSTLERWHRPASVGKAVRAVRSAGIKNINLDLIFSVPGQTLQILDADLDATLTLAPDHVSCYGLTYEPQTALSVRLKKGQIRQIDPKLERQMYDRVIKRLDTAGFEHYEISSWATPNHRCEHNLIYWRNEAWLGVGPSAASHIDGYRWKNEAHLGRYLALHPEPPTTDHERLPAWRSVGEQLMMKLRVRDGVAHTWFAQHVPEQDPRHTTITELIEAGMLEWADHHLRLTRRGIFVADAVIEKVL